MDPSRFDRLASALGRATSRRAAFAVLVGGLLAPLPPGHGEAARRKGPKRRDRDNERPGNRGERRGRKRKRKKAPAQPGVGHGCCATGACAPGPGKNLAQCCYEGQNLAGASFRGANLGRANFSGAVLTNADFRSANLDRTCFVDADLTGAGLAGANAGTAIFCRTTMPDGSTDDSGCDRGTGCCPTCDDENPCRNDEVCCRGRCVSGDCCSDAQCTDPAKPVCIRHTCSPCATNAQCGAGNVCCEGRCFGGDCCQDHDCAPGGNLCTGHECSCGAGPACSGAAPFCCGAGDQGACRECCRDQQCPASDPVCAPDGTCVQCRAADDCPTPPECRERVCSEDGQCATDPASGGTCAFPGGGSGTCQNGQCICPAPRQTCRDGCCAAGQVCDAVSQRCCTPSKTTCQAGVDCGQVSDGCGRTIDCGPCRNPTPICSADHTCVACTHDAQCGAGSVCCGGSCFAGVCCRDQDCAPRGNRCANHACACGAGPPCAAPADACCGHSPGGSCADTQTDPANCGGCGHACATGQVCVAGRCGCSANAPDLCGNRCVNMQTDPQNCGRCGNICRSGNACVSGVCRGQGTCTARENTCQSAPARCDGRSFCSCFRTTSGATFCGDASRCSPCTHDADCDPVTGPGSACADFTGPGCGCRPANRACVRPCADCEWNGAPCIDNRQCCSQNCSSGACAVSPCTSSWACGFGPMPKCGSDRDGDCLCLPVEHNPGEPDRICVKDHGYCVDCDTCREELGGYCLVRSRCFNCPTACAIPCGTPFPRVEGDDGSVVLPSPIATSPP